MAKFASIITLLFVALVLFAALEAPNMVGAMNFGDDPSQDPTQRCLGPDCRTGEPVTTGPGYRAPKSCMRPSGTLRGVCENDITCKDRCAKIQGARHGSCRNGKSCACFLSC